MVKRLGIILGDNLIMFINKEDIYFKKDKVFKDSNSMRERGDCAVKALAINANIDYRNAHALFKKAGRKHRDGCHWGIIKFAYGLVGLGFEVVEEKIRAKTPVTFKRLNLPEDENYLISFSGHVAAAKGNNILDWTRGKRNRILEVYKIVKLKE